MENNDGRFYYRLFHHFQTHSHSIFFLVFGVSLETYGVKLIQINQILFFFIKYKY